jgi:hypothetical protein
LIQYIAQLLGRECLRVNNHEHTDLQEYVGSYTTNDKGELVFQEGKGGEGRGWEVKGPALPITRGNSCFRKVRGRGGRRGGEYVGSYSTNNKEELKGSYTTNDKGELVFQEGEGRGPTPPITRGNWCFRKVRGDGKVRGGVL